MPVKPMPFKHMVFSGGGINGLHTLGSLRFIEALDPGILLRVRGFAGTSIGAAVALMCVLGLSTGSMIQMLNHLVSVVGNIRVTMPLSRGALDPTIISETLRQAFMDQVGQPDMTFKQLHDLTKKELVVCALNLNKLKPVMFTFRETPNVSVCDAVQASMSLPVVFPPVQIGQDLYIDGGLMQNFAIDVFPAESTLGIWLRSKSPQASTSELLASFGTYIRQLAMALLHAQDDVLMQGREKHGGPTIVVMEQTCRPMPVQANEVDVPHMVFTGAFSTFLFFRDKQPSNVVDRALITFMNQFQLMTASEEKK